MAHKTMVKYSKSPAKNGGYILTNGNFINFSEQESSCFVTHSYFGRVFLQSRRYKSLIETDSAIAFNDAVVKMDAFKQERAYIDIPKQEPTKEQYESLLKWLYHALCVSKTIDINGLGFVSFEFISKDNEEGYTPEQIIKEIKKIYRRNSNYD